MHVTSEWIRTLADRRNIRFKDIRDALWPEYPSRGISYFDRSKNMTQKYIEKLCELLSCSADELLRLDYAKGASIIAGNNNSVGNVNINSDVKVLQDTINNLHEIIARQDLELSRKDAEIKAMNGQIDRLIKLAQK